MEPMAIAHSEEIRVNYVERFIEEVREEAKRWVKEIIFTRDLSRPWGVKKPILDRCFQERRRYYPAYLESSHWAIKRIETLKRVKDEKEVPRCEAWVRCDGAMASVAHHTSYRHMYNEPLWHLKATCQVCHDDLHDREDDPWQ
jgi:hypothetical protein